MIIMLPDKEGVREYLKKNGYDGLYNIWGGCACDLRDLFCCGAYDKEECKPGIRVGCKCGNRCKYHIIPKSTRIRKYCGKDNAEKFKYYSL